MKTSYYSNNFKDFIQEPKESILGKLNSSFNLQNLNIKQTNAWEYQIDILKSSLRNISSGKIYFEFSIPRMGKRADNILIIGGLIYILEFKVGSKEYDRASINQVVDYSLDMQNFHEGSHDHNIVPILICSNGAPIENEYEIEKGIFKTIMCNSNNLYDQINYINMVFKFPTIDVIHWEDSYYKPTPTIIEAAQALYQNHNVEDISRNEAGDNLIITTETLNSIINSTKESDTKSICFVTGVPGAGKTLVGLNIVNERKKLDKLENAVFLSGNGPLVMVLREALAQDRKLTSISKGVKIKIEDARREFNSKIQNIHHFRDEYFKTQKPPNEKVVIFDESQRAWNRDKTVKFVKEKYKNISFSKSEPEFLIDFMNRHSGWCTIVCLVGGGQEINTGEAGIEEWILALKNKFPLWKIYFSNTIIETDSYIESKESICWAKNNGIKKSELHLSTSMRSFRSKNISEYVESLLVLNHNVANQMIQQIQNKYPLSITRNLNTAKSWLKLNSRGSERSGIIVSSSARRLRASGIDAENGVRSNSDKGKITSWFLADNHDIRSSSFLEVPATQFAIQGLELDWVCLAWGGDLSFNGTNWDFRKFIGSKWVNIRGEKEKEFLINTYRVLLTRARQGIIIYIPEGDNKDMTRPKEQYDKTFNYLKQIGIKEV